MRETVKPQGFISLFTRHRVAANLLMLLMILAGMWALLRLNIQFFPSFNIEVVSVQVAWPGASAEDVENSITNPLEQEFRNLDNLKTIDSVARTGSGSFFIEFEQGSDMGKALEDVRERISQIRNLPPDSEKPIITRIEPYERIATLVISGPNNLDEIRSLVHEFERELLDLGITKIDILGLPDEEIAIQISTTKLVELNLSLTQIANRIAQHSRDLPAGTIGKADVGRQLRSLEQRRTIHEFEQLPILSNRSGQLIRLADIAKIERRSQDDEVKITYHGKPGVEMRLLRSSNMNALTSANILHKWLNERRPQLGKSLQIHVYDENWQYIKERINLLLKNGTGGLILITGILFLLLNRRVAWWVVVGIPASFMAALAALYLYGESINMVSLFAFIMSLGIIVDDTIVVGEQTLTNIHSGFNPLDAVEKAAYKMLAPISASSLTTVCAFLPLFLVTGIIGTILFAIPLVVICVILASLLECFYVLPGHLYHSFTYHQQEKEPAIREKINRKFELFREKYFRRLVKYALHFRWITLSLALALFLLAIGLVIGGHINFTLFPSPEGRLVLLDVQFTAGTPPEKVVTFMKHVNQTLNATNKELSKEKTLLKTAITLQNYSRITNYRANRGENYASMRVELISPDQRRIRNIKFINTWKSKIKFPPGIENFAIYSPRPGPPGEDIDILFLGKDAKQLKQAAIELKNILHTIPGVSDVKDNLPFGQEQLVYKLNATGEAERLTIEDVGRQLRAAFNGRIAQIFHEPDEEIEVRVMLPDQERYRLSTLEQFPIIIPNGRTAPLGTVVTLNYRRAPDILLHTDTKLGVHITATVDSTINNANKIIQSLSKKTLPDITNKYNLKLSLKGRMEEQMETFADMKYGLVIGLILIYIILAWVFNSYGWPLVVMAAIPLGLTGAIFGHLVMGLDLTILSLFGLFGLSGIVVNDSIILLSEYRLLRSEGMPTRPAIIEASCRRLRAVLLTSLTTIAGLTPLLFERSLQAQFLIPMATSITFGLAYATLLILVFVPTSLSVYERLKQSMAR